MFIKINTYLINTKWHNVWHVLPFWGRGGGFKSWQFKTASEIMSTNVKKKILSGYFQRIFEKKNSNDILRIIQIWINKSIDFDTTFLYDQRFTVLWFFFIFLSHARIFSTHHILDPSGTFSFDSTHFLRAALPWPRPLYPAAAQTYLCFCFFNSSSIYNNKLSRSA